MILGNENSAFYLEKTSGDLYTNQSLDREATDMYHLYIMASKKSDLHISEAERSAYSIKSLERDSNIAKVQITVLDVNDNAPVFDQAVYYAGVNSKSQLNQLVAMLNASDSDLGINGTFEIVILASNLYKYGSSKSTGSIVPSPFGKAFFFVVIFVIFIRFFAMISHFQGGTPDDCYHYGRVQPGSL